MRINIILISLIVTLSGCNDEPAPEPAKTEEPAAAPAPSAPPPVESKPAAPACLYDVVKTINTQGNSPMDGAVQDYFSCSDGINPNEAVRVYKNGDVFWHNSLQKNYRFTNQPGACDVALYKDSSSVLVYKWTDITVDNGELKRFTEETVATGEKVVWNCYFLDV